MVTITRKIELRLIDNFKENYKQLYEWNELTFRAANLAVNHMYFQNKMQEFFYLTDEAKILFSDINKQDSEKDKGKTRVINTSQQNSSYQVLSSYFKGKLPSDIYTNLNSSIYSSFKKEKKDYFSGKRSLRSYRRNMPIPFSASNIRNLTPTEDEKNYNFSLFNINFRTFFGRDASGNKIILDRALQGEYKLCNSSIQLDGKKIFLLAVFQFEELKFELKENIIMEAELSTKYPILLSLKNKTYKIGDKEEYLHRRIAIQAALRRQQISARYNKNGKGRKAKMHSVERFTKAEYNYINTRQHQYTFKVIKLCLQNKCSVLRLKIAQELAIPDNLTKEELYKWKEANQLLLRNWGYHGLQKKLQYKCKKVGIKLEVDKKENNIEPCFSSR